jgi:hypothetical protein
MGLFELRIMTLGQRLLATLLAMVMMFVASAMLWVYWDLAVR